MKKEKKRQEITSSGSGKSSYLTGNWMPIPPMVSLATLGKGPPLTRLSYPPASLGISLLGSYRRAESYRAEVW